jgi:hypothetical protein
VGDSDEVNGIGVPVGQPVPSQGVGDEGVDEVGVRAGHPNGVGVGEAAGQPCPSQGVGTQVGQSGVGVDEGKSANGEADVSPVGASD